MKYGKRLDEEVACQRCSAEILRGESFQFEGLWVCCDCYRVMVREGLGALCSKTKRIKNDKKD